MPRGASQQDAGHEHGHLHRARTRPMRCPVRRDEHDHQRVARSGAHPGADVEGRPDAEQQDAGDQQPDARRHRRPGEPLDRVDRAEHVDAAPITIAFAIVPNAGRLTGRPRRPPGSPARPRCSRRPASAACAARSPGAGRPRAAGRAGLQHQRRSRRRTGETARAARRADRAWAAREDAGVPHAGSAPSIADPIAAALAHASLIARAYRARPGRPAAGGRLTVDVGSRLPARRLARDPRIIGTRATRPASAAERATGPHSGSGSSRRPRRGSCGSLCGRPGSPGSARTPGMCGGARGGCCGQRAIDDVGDGCIDADPSR